MRLSLASVTLWGVLLAASTIIAQEAPAPRPAAEAAAAMTLPPGFRATLFAGEPDVVQPIAMATDDRGRLWVVECMSYPDWKEQGQDRVLIFEDADGDGRFDRRTVFWDQGANLSGIEIGFGGVWLCATPNLLFVPDKNGDDRPDGPAEVVLDGWDLKARHNVFAALSWGPDGWLYGCNGILSNSRLGKPGTPDAERVPINCGVWRLHPLRRTFEAVAWGTTNPWGLDFDDYGQMFITNCVIEHAWHTPPGAHFKRMFGQDLNPNVYGLLESGVDHIHWGGGPWQQSRGGQGAHDKPGGGHAHAGALVYLGDNWPPEYRNNLLACNIHGNRLNNDLLRRRGAGYTIQHGPDLLYANDTWFRGLSLQASHDGAVYVSDWCDSGECHDYIDVHRTTGRIYKITHGKPAARQVDLAKLGDAELVQLQTPKNDWLVRHARRLLQERAAAGSLGPQVQSDLTALLQSDRDVRQRLRALWALHVTSDIDDALFQRQLTDKEEYVRGWAIQLALEDRQVSEPILKQLVALAANDPAPLVRLYLASALQRLPFERRWDIATALAAHSEDAADAYLPLMIWYGIEPLSPADPKRAAELASKSRIPLVRQYLARRLALLEDQKLAASPLAPLVAVLAQTDDGAVARDLLQGIYEAYKGRRNMVMPASWQAASAHLATSKHEEVTRTTLLLSTMFGDRAAIGRLREVTLDLASSQESRETALEALVQRREADVLPLLYGLLRDRAMRGPALRGLAAFGDAETPKTLLKDYSTLTEDEKRDAVNTLASRPAFAEALLEAVGTGQVPRGDLSVFTVRQLLALNQPRIKQLVEKNWGTLRPPAQDKVAQIDRFKKLLTPSYLAAADASHGRALFAKNCATCHVLFDDGRKIGPDLTGSQRANLDYVLENLLDPSAVVAREFRVSIVQTTSGRVITGMVLEEAAQTITVQTPNERLIVPRSEIEEQVQSPLSMMPEGVLQNLSETDFRDLVAYLASPKQVPKPAGTAPDGEGK